MTDKEIVLRKYPTAICADYSYGDKSITPTIVYIETSKDKNEQIETQISRRSVSEYDTWKHAAQLIELKIPSTKDSLNALINSLEHIWSHIINVEEFNDKDKWNEYLRNNPQEVAKLNTLTRIKQLLRDEIKLSENGEIVN